MRFEEAEELNEEARRLKQLRESLRELRREEKARFGWDGKVEIGDYTYGTPTVRSWGEDAKLRIGKFCSIGANVKIYLGGNHHTEWITTYPFNAMPMLRGLWSDIDGGVAATKGDVTIGNDVWIADDVTIMSGVTIGDGAVIANGAVVTENIPLYCVAGGVPARPKTWRSAANGVISLKWWDWPEEKLAAAARILMSEDEYMLKKFAEEWKDE